MNQINVYTFQNNAYKLVNFTTIITSYVQKLNTNISEYMNMQVL